MSVCLLFTLPLTIGVYVCLSAGRPPDWRDEPHSGGGRRDVHLQHRHQQQDRQRSTLHIPQRYNANLASSLYIEPMIFFMNLILL